MLLCDQCNKKPATVHLTQIINNNKKEMHLCEDCANKNSLIFGGKFDFEQKFNFHSLLSDLMGDSYVVDKKAVKCQKCGMTQKSIAEGSFLGCAECYEIFQSQVLPMIKRIHGTTQHIGKVPERTSGKAKVIKKMRDLKVALEDAIKKEEFEKAAKIRNEIRSLKKQLGVV